MLVLPRKQGERLVVEYDTGSVEITIVAIDRDKVRLGITAPREATLYRPEMVSNPPPEPPPVRTVIGSLAAGIRKPLQEAIANGVAADALLTALRLAAEQSIAALVASKAHGHCSPPPAAALDGT